MDGDYKKPCYRCSKRKPLSAFHRASHMKDGHRNICNVGIGSLRDDVGILAAAIEYLEAHRG